MVRVIVDQVLNEGKRYIEAAGLSTDTKPTANVVTGSLFLEVDTSDAYFFDEVSGDWIKAGGGVIDDG